MAEQLLERLKYLDGADEAAKGSEVKVREELVKIVSQLFHDHLEFAMENRVGELLWASQQRLYGQMKKQLDEQTLQTQTLSSAAESKGKRRELYEKIGKMNCANVLDTLYAEWTQLAFLVENKNEEQLVELSLLPVEEQNVEAIASMNPTNARRMFALLLYAKLAEISELMSAKALSHQFKGAMARIDKGSNGD